MSNFHRNSRLKQWELPTLLVIILKNVLFKKLEPEPVSEQAGALNTLLPQFQHNTATFSYIGLRAKLLENVFRNDLHETGRD